MMKEKLIAITAKEARKLCDKLGLSFPEQDGKTFFATNKERTEVYEYESKKERDKRCY